MRALAPWTGVSTMKKEMDRLFDRFWEGDFPQLPSMGEWAPALDVSETKNAVMVKAEVPGMDPKDIDKIWIWNNHGELVKLSDVVDIKLKPSLLSITRRDRDRAIGIFANVAPGKSQADALDSVNKIAKEVLPEGYRVVFSGSGFLPPRLALPRCPTR